VADRVAGRNFTRAGLLQFHVSIVCKYRVVADANRRFQAGRPDTPNHFDHRTRGRDDVIDQDRRSVTPFSHLRNRDLDVSVSPSRLFQNDERRAGICGNRGNPLFALTVWTDQQRSWNRFLNPVRNEGAAWTTKLGTE